MVTCVNSIITIRFMQNVSHKTYSRQLKPATLLWNFSVRLVISSLGSLKSNSFRSAL